MDYERNSWKNLKGQGRNNNERYYKRSEGKNSC